jgi:hypothetical protein
MKIRSAISLVLVLVFTAVNAFGLACETSCEFGTATGNHHHHGVHTDVAATAASSTMDPTMDMSSMPDQTQIGAQAIHLVSENGMCVCPLSRSECMLDHAAATSPATPYLLLSPISALPAAHAMTGCPIVNARPPNRAAASVHWQVHRIPTILRI